ncbi:MAG: beta-lactamase family protein [Colwellia sp.]|nr:beta-lactamase family protein [Colwellia sp.]
MKVKNKSYLIFSILIMITGNIQAQVKDDKDVKANINLAREWIKNQLEYDGVPGASIAVVYDQEVVWSEGFGFSSLKGKVKATADTKYSICSVSKLFTSIGVMQLRDKNKLSIDAPINSILPWYKMPQHKNQEEPVTLRNILSHVSGLPREAVTPYWVDTKFPSHKTLQQGTGKQKPLYKPYERFQYSNLGLSLAGEAIAQASGTDFHTYIKNNILTPLKMTNTTSELPIEEYGKSFAAGYKLRNAQGHRDEVGPYEVKALAPAAGFASSANDLAKFASWQFRLQEKGGEDILKATTLREMQRVQWTAPDMDGATWGFGFALWQDNNKTFVGHGGYCPGYRTSFVTRVQDKLAIIAMVNVNDVSPSKLTKGLHALLSEPIKQAAKTQADEASDNNNSVPDGSSIKKLSNDTSQEIVDLSIYEGVFGLEGWPWSIAIAATSDGLKGIDLFDDKPNQRPLKLKHEEGHVFRVISKNGEELHSAYFELDKQGKAIRFWEHGQYAERLN